MKNKIIYYPTNEDAVIICNEISVNPVLSTGRMLSTPKRRGIHSK